MSWRKKLLFLIKPKLDKLDVVHRTDHSLRVYKLCERIAKSYKNANLDVLYAASLLHDIGKIVCMKNEHSHHSVTFAKAYLKKAGFPDNKFYLVKEAIEKHDDYVWVKKHSNNKPKGLDAKIFQDADRLESMGAIGISRNLIWAGEHKKTLYDNKKAWKDDVIYGGNISALHTIHFEQKDYAHLNTSSAKKIAREKYVFGEKFINQFIKEWKN
jgi:uncharacterized protein